MTELERYIDFMTKEHNTFSWEIGWESLPKYIGHKIFNTKTNKIATVNWDNGYPQLFDENGEEIVCRCCDFRHDNAYWIYKIGENYEVN